MVRSLLFVSLITIGSVSPAAELKRVGSVPLALFGATEAGKVLAKVDGRPQVLLWDPAMKDWSLIYKPQSNGPIPAGYSMGTSRSGHHLFVREEYLPVPQKLPAGLKVVDLTLPKPTAVAIPETRDYRTLPIVSPDDSQYLFFSIDYQAKPSWKFPLAEYLFDQQQGTAQPTGFYLDEIPELTAGRAVVSGSYSPDGTKVALVEGHLASVTRGRYYDDDDYGDYDEDGDYDEEYKGYGGAGSYGYGYGVGRSIKIFDFETKKTQSIPVTEQVVEVYWPQENTLIARTQSYGNSGSILRVSIKEKKQEVIDKEKSFISEVSPDGKWMAYRHDSTKKDAPAVFYLYNIERKSRYEFRNAVSAVFPPNSAEVVLQPAGKSDEVFARVDLSPYNERTAEAVLDLAKPGVTRFASTVPVYEAPEDAKQLAESFEFTHPSLSGPSAYPGAYALGARVMPAPIFRVHLYSKASQFFQLKGTKGSGIVLELFDAKGDVVPLENLNGVEKLPQTIGPGDFIEFTALLRTKGGFLPPGFTGKLKVSLEGYEGLLSREFDLK